MKLTIKDDDSVLVELDDSGGSYQDGYDDGYQAGYEYGTSSILSAENLGKVIMVEPDTQEIVLSNQDSLRIIENGQFDTTVISSVDVEIEIGYTAFETVSGTISNILGDSGYTFLEVAEDIENFKLSTSGSVPISIDASAIGAGRANGAMDVGLGIIVAYGASVDATSSQAFRAVWNNNGLVSAYMEQNGTITDLTQYGSLITTVIGIPISI